MNKIAACKDNFSINNGRLRILLSNHEKVQMNFPETNKDQRKTKVLTLWLSKL